jgi:hypothetical protein
LKRRRKWIIMIVISLHISITIYYHAENYRRFPINFTCYRACWNNMVNRLYNCFVMIFWCNNELKKKYWNWRTSLKERDDGIQNFPFIINKPWRSKRYRKLSEIPTRCSNVALFNSLTGAGIWKINAVKNTVKNAFNISNVLEWWWFCTL